MADDTNSTNGATNGTLPALATSASDFLSHTYDYIIVGGGTAGLVLAARLSENPDIHVGVLEAGANKLDDPLVDTPALFSQMLGNPSYDWNLKTVPQPGNLNRTHHIPRGKLLGGSSGINYMMYVRGSERDYDDWATLSGDRGWSFAALRPYAAKHQTLEPVPEGVAAAVTAANHGGSGPIRTRFNDARLAIEDAWVAAAAEAAGGLGGLGGPPADAWGGDHYGFYHGLGSVYGTGRLRGRRSYAARGYFEENAGRRNLTVLCEAPVARVVLERDRGPGLGATGVEFAWGGERHRVRAGREVLVCAGAIHSPQILELSGIGDPEVLRRAGVEVKVELPAVGNNFQDHVIAGAHYELGPGEVSMDSLFEPQAMAEAQKAFVEQGAGPLTGVVSAQGFVSYKQLAPPDEHEETIKSIRKAQESCTPFQKRQLDLVIEHLEDEKSANLQYIMAPATPVLAEEAVNDQAKMWPPGDPAHPGFVLACCLQYPVSRGSVHIASADPTQPPTIDPAYLAHPADVAVLATGLQLFDKMAASPALAPRIRRRTYPAPEVDLADAGAARRAVRDWVIGEYHVAGSCAMGDAVVDGRLRVRGGVRALRVVDASVFPSHVSGNCQSSVYALAERAADLIKFDNDDAAVGKQG